MSSRNAARGGSGRLLLRDGIQQHYPDVLTVAALDALEALAEFNRERQRIMRERIQRRAARFREGRRIGFLDPVDKITGAQARLKNLGFFRGAIDGTVDANTRAAIMSFQNRYGLPANGVLEAQTMNKLLEVHGS